jgi:fermentation-respiration switch protein FrsA (DUF1100 family)
MSDGMKLNIQSATLPPVETIRKITCPVLTISAADDAFGTAFRARSIAAGVPDGRAVIYPSGGHALIGHFADLSREIVSFFGSKIKLRPTPVTTSLPAVDDE